MHLLHLILVCFTELLFGKTHPIDCHFKIEPNIKIQHLQNNTSVQLQCLWQRCDQLCDEKKQGVKLWFCSSRAFEYLRNCEALLPAGYLKGEGFHEALPSDGIDCICRWQFCSSVLCLSRRFLWPAFTGWCIFPVTFCFTVWIDFLGVASQEASSPPLPVVGGWEGYLQYHGAQFSKGKYKKLSLGLQNLTVICVLQFLSGWSRKSESDTF